MYTIKLVRADDEQKYFDCAHVSIKTVGPNSVAAREGLAQPGVTFELSTGATIELPRDGKALYIVNSQGVTIDAHYWPPRRPVGSAGPRKD